MKESYKDISMIDMCKWFCISRQAYYQHEWDVAEEVFQSGLLLAEIKHIRHRHPRIGGRKLQELLRHFMQEHGIKMGRDALFDFLSTYGLLVRKRKRYVRTTFSHHWLKKYSNLVVDFVPMKPNELWVSDITYWKIGEITFYITFITDAYSRKIIGYHLSENLHAEQTAKALKMALRELKDTFQSNFQLIHHSDRGVQYCSTSYVNLLKENHIQISMTQSGDPLENAIAERVNGIIKDEYLFDYKCNNINDAKKKLAGSVFLYNNERPHSSIGNLTPELVHNCHHQTHTPIRKLWKNYHTKNRKGVADEV